MFQFRGLRALLFVSGRRIWLLERSRGGIRFPQKYALPFWFSDLAKFLRSARVGKLDLKSPSAYGAPLRQKMLIDFPEEGCRSPNRSLPIWPRPPRRSGLWPWIGRADRTAHGDRVWAFLQGAWPLSSERPPYAHSVYFNTPRRSVHS